MALLPAATGAGGVNDAATTNAQQKLNLQYITQFLRDIFGTSDSSTARQTVIDFGSDNPVTVTAAATTSLATGNVVTVSNTTGATTITSFGTAANGARRTVVFSITGGSVAITHNATTLQLPRGGNLAVQNGDQMQLVSLGGGNWRCEEHIPAFGLAPSGSSVNIVTVTATTVLTTAHLGSTVFLSAAAALTITLPSSALCPVGSVIRLRGYISGGFGATITRAGTDVIYNGPGTSTTTTGVYGSDFLELTSNGANGWHVTSGQSRFESAWTATLPAAAVAISVTHSLGSTPRYVYLLIECTTADQGYAIGDRIVNPSLVLNASANTATPMWANATSVGFTTTAITPTWSIVHKTAGTIVNPTVASWKYKLIAEM